MDSGIVNRVIGVLCDRIKQLEEENKTLMAHPPYSWNPNDEKDAERWRAIRKAGLTNQHSEFKLRGENVDVNGSMLIGSNADKYVDWLMKK